jgi:hypothetical protein
VTPPTEPLAPKTASPDDGEPPKVQERASWVAPVAGLSVIVPAAVWAGMPWWGFLLLCPMALVVALASATVPQNSADRVTWWRELWSHREHMPILEAALNRAERMHQQHSDSASRTMQPTPFGAKPAHNPSGRPLHARADDLAVPKRHCPRAGARSDRAAGTRALAKRYTRLGRGRNTG